MMNNPTNFFCVIKANKHKLFTLLTDFSTDFKLAFEMSFGVVFMFLSLFN